MEVLTRFPTEHVGAVLKVLVTAAGCPGWQSIVEAIRAWGVGRSIDIVGSEIWGYGGGMPGVFGVAPGGHEQYPHSVIELVRAEGIAAIVPLSDPELVPLARISEGLGELGCEVLCSPVRSLEIVMDRERLWHQFPSLSPDSTLLTRAEAGSLDPARLAGRFVRLRGGYGSRGVKKLVSREAIVAAFETMKPENFGGLFPVDMLRELLEHHGEIMVVEDLPGAEYSVDCIFDPSHDLVGYGVRERTVIRNGICHKATFVSDVNGEFRRAVDEIGGALLFSYCINLQFRRDRSGVIKLLEINPRTPGSIGAWLPAGINPMAMVMDLATGRHVSAGEFAPGVPITRRVSHFV